MGRGRHCSREMRILIKRLIQERKTYKDIQEILNCSAKMISNALKWEEKPETRGRKRATTKKGDSRIVRLSKKHPFLSSKHIKSSLNLNVSTSTVRRRLIEANLHARSPRKVPLLTKRHIKQRLIFAKEHADWPLEKWRNILWSDESKVVLFGCKGRREYVRRPAGAAFMPQYTIKTVKHGGLSLMVWGCFSYNGVGPIIEIVGIMNKEYYLKKVLQEVMYPYASDTMPLRWVFQQDNDPKHTSKVVKEWFRVNKVNVLPWAAQSPDLNPIENLWTDIKNAVSDQKPTTKSQLWNVVQSAWNNIPIERCQALVDSMPRRCEAVIRNKGQATKY